MAVTVVKVRLPSWGPADDESATGLTAWPEKEHEVLIFPSAAEPADGAPEAAGEGPAEGASPEDRDAAAVKKAAASMGDLYAVLGLESRRWLASQDEIRTAYRKVVLHCHPDKRHEFAATTGQEPLEEEEANRRFQELQHAFETLSDQKRRREYDSQDDFDDSIPKTPLPAGSDFFDIYGPVFVRNARWSERQPVPTLGSADSDFTDVAHFYNFWYDFRSWRVFASADEHDLSEAEFREERRWMERQNEKARAARKRVETARIAALVEGAYLHDPRVCARREEERASKDRARKEAAEEAEKAAQAAAEEEALRQAQAEEDKRKAAESSAARKKAKERERDAIRKARQRVRGLAAALTEGPGMQRVAVVCAELKVGELTDLADQMEAAGDDVQAIAALVDRVSEPLLANQGLAATHTSAASAAPLATPPKTSSKKARVWSERELELLKKGCVKFPVGVPARWAKVADFINEAVGDGDLTEAHVSAQIKEQRKATAAPVTRRAGAAGPASTPPMPEAATAPNANSAAGAAGAAWELATPAPAPQAPVEAPKSIAAQGPTADNGKAGTPSTATEPGGGEEEWTAEQQQALEQALVQVPKSDELRWTRIAERVPGKTRKQCVARFKHLVAVVNAKKADAGQ